MSRLELIDVFRLSSDLSFRHKIVFWLETVVINFVFLFRQSNDLCQIRRLRVVFAPVAKVFFAPGAPSGQYIGHIHNEFIARM